MDVSVKSERRLVRPARVREAVLILRSTNGYQEQETREGSQEMQGL
jgi:hypothetical protein